MSSPSNRRSLVSAVASAGLLPIPTTPGVYNSSEIAASERIKSRCALRKRHARRCDAESATSESDALELSEPSAARSIGGRPAAARSLLKTAAVS